MGHAAVEWVVASTAQARSDVMTAVLGAAGHGRPQQPVHRRTELAVEAMLVAGPAQTGRILALCVLDPVNRRVVTSGVARQTATGPTGPAVEVASIVRPEFRVHKRASAPAPELDGRRRGHRALVAGSVRRAREHRVPVKAMKGPGPRGLVRVPRVRRVDLVLLAGKPVRQNGAGRVPARAVARADLALLGGKPARQGAADRVRVGARVRVGRGPTQLEARHVRAVAPGAAETPEDVAAAALRAMRRSASASNAVLARGRRSVAARSEIADAGASPATCRLRAGYVADAPARWADRPAMAAASRKLWEVAGDDSLEDAASCRMVSSALRVWHRPGRDDGGQVAGGNGQTLRGGAGHRATAAAVIASRRWSFARWSSSMRCNRS